LSRYRGSKGFYLPPGIPAKKLANATYSCAVPQTDRILAMLDITFWGSAKDCLLFGTTAFYYHSTPRSGCLAYRQFPGRTFSANWIGTKIHLGSDEFFSKGQGTLSASQIVQLLTAIKELVEEFSAADLPATESEKVEPARLQQEGETHLTNFLEEALNRTQGKPTHADTAAFHELRRQYNVPSERAKQIMQEFTREWQRLAHG
jgi:hypothetical protein